MTTLALGIFLLLVCFGLLILFQGKHRKVFLASVLRRTPIPSTLIGPPKGTISAAEYSRRHEQKNVVVHPAHQFELPTFPIPNPLWLRKEQRDLPTGRSEISFPETFVLTFDEGRIYGVDGVSLTKQDRILGNNIMITATDHIPKHPVQKMFKLPPVTSTQERVVNMASYGVNVFYHWMFEILPRFEILKLSGVPYDKVYFHRPELPFQKETFAMMGLQEEQMIWAAPEAHLKAKQVIVPSIPSLHANPSQWVCQFLRERFLSPTATPRRKRIFVSRKQAVYRHLVNEQELMAILSRYGFEEVVLEGMTVQEQIHLFQASEIVVAPHGAGLSHLVFCDPGTKMVEIFNPHWICDCYWKLSQHVGLKHFCLLGVPVNAPRTPEEKYDYHYDCSGFERFLCEEIF